VSLAASAYASLFDSSVTHVSTETTPQHAGTARWGNPTRYATSPIGTARARRIRTLDGVAGKLSRSQMPAHTQFHTQPRLIRPRSALTVDLRRSTAELRASDRPSRSPWARTRCAASRAAADAPPNHRGHGSCEKGLDPTVRPSAVRALSAHGAARHANASVARGPRACRFQCFHHGFLVPTVRAIVGAIDSCPNGAPRGIVLPTARRCTSR
jgi:hypothetical protein